MALDFEDGPFIIRRRGDTLSPDALGAIIDRLDTDPTFAEAVRMGVEQEISEAT